MHGPIKVVTSSISMYTVLHIFAQVLFWAENQGNHQHFDPSLLPKKLWLTFMGMKKKIEKKFQLKKTEIFNSANSQYFSRKLMWRALMWLNVYGRQAVRRKDVMQKTQKMHF